MTYRDKNKRIYPYNTGLELGSEIDIILVNENSEPLNAENFLSGIIKVEHTGGQEAQGPKSEENIISCKNGMAHIHSTISYCRAYCTDNIWFLLKYLIKHLKKDAFISYLPIIYGEELEGLNDDKTWVAGGHLVFMVHKSLYDATKTNELRSMTNDFDHESHQRLIDNLRITIGLFSLLLDRRESAERRRREFGPFSDKEFRRNDKKLVYQTPTNFWLFSPILAHLMFGAARWAYFMTQNNFECDVWEGFESGDIQNAIHHSNYDTGMEIWELMKARIQEAGYNNTANPFGQQQCAVLEMLFEYGVGAIGDGIYKNWRMNRKLDNYRGHFDDLPSWEHGASGRIFTNSHPMHKVIQKYM